MGQQSIEADHATTKAGRGIMLREALTKSWVIQSGTVAPIQLRINVLAAMAEAA